MPSLAKMLAELRAQILGLIFKVGKLLFDWGAQAFGTLTDAFKRSAQMLIEVCGQLPAALLDQLIQLAADRLVSKLEELANGSFLTVIPEVEYLDPKKVRRIIACSGKVYYDLLAYRKEQKIVDIAIIRIEQLYPFPHDDFQAEVDRYDQANDVLWCQEEPGNQGAWHRIQHYLLRHLGLNQTLGYALRPSSASPAAGYLAKHNFEQNELVVAAFRKRI